MPASTKTQQQPPAPPARPYPAQSQSAARADLRTWFLTRARPRGRLRSSAPSPSSLHVAAGPPAVACTSGSTIAHRRPHRRLRPHHRRLRPHRQIHRRPRRRPRRPPHRPRRHSPPARGTGQEFSAVGQLWFASNRTSSSYCARRNGVRARGAGRVTRGASSAGDSRRGRNAPRCTIRRRRSPSGCQRRSCRPR